MRLSHFEFLGALATARILRKLLSPARVSLDAFDLGVVERLIVQQLRPALYEVEAQTQQSVVIARSNHFQLAAASRNGQANCPAPDLGLLRKVIARFMLRYRVSASFTGRHSYGVPHPLLNNPN